MLQDALKFLIIIKSRKQRMVYMRQGGMVPKPKNHDSGVYWIRALLQVVVMEIKK